MAAETAMRWLKKMNTSLGELTFARMQPMHVEQVLAIEKTSFPTPWSRQAFYYEVTENDFAFYLVALHEGKVIAYVGIWLVLDEAHITNVAVHPDYRGCGVGRAIMLEIIGSAVLLGAIRMTLEVRPSNYVAIDLYESLGFGRRGIRKGYYTDTNEDAIIMWKEPLFTAQS